MKKLLLSGLACIFFLTSCKKEELNYNYAEVDNQSNDNLYFEKNSNLLFDEINNLIEGSSISRLESLYKPCDAVLDSFYQADKLYTLQFTKGSPCGFLDGTRSGKVEIRLIAGNSWSDDSSKISITFKDFKISKENHSISLNGTKEITNITGRLIKNLANDDSIIHLVSANNLSVTFEDGSKKSWNIAQKRVYKKNIVGDQSLIVSGFGTPLTYKNVSEWGQSRIGNNYYNMITKPLVFKNCSGKILPFTGEKTIKGLSREVTITYGIDSNGFLVSDACNAYGVKIKYIDFKGNIKESLYAE